MGHCAERRVFTTGTGTGTGTGGKYREREENDGSGNGMLSHKVGTGNNGSEKHGGTGRLCIVFYCFFPSISIDDMGATSGVFFFFLLDLSFF